MNKDHWVSGTLRLCWATREQGRGVEIVATPLMETDPSFSFDTSLDPDNYKFTETH